MKATAGFLGIIFALGAALYLYNGQLTRAGGSTTSPQEQIDVTGIRMALFEIAQAEAHVTLPLAAPTGTLEQLRAEGAPALWHRPPRLRFSGGLNGSLGFTATATPTDPNKKEWPDSLRSTRACRLPNGDVALAWGMVGFVEAPARR